MWRIKIFLATAIIIIVVAESGNCSFLHDSLKKDVKLQSLNHVQDSISDDKLHHHKEELQESIRRYLLEIELRDGIEPLFPHGGSIELSQFEDIRIYPGNSDIDQSEAVKKLLRQYLSWIGNGWKPRRLDIYETPVVNYACDVLWYLSNSDEISRFRTPQGFSCDSREACIRFLCKYYEIEQPLTASSKKQRHLIEDWCSCLIQQTHEWSRFKPKFNGETWLIYDVLAMETETSGKTMFDYLTFRYPIAGREAYTAVLRVARKFYYDESSEEYKFLLRQLFNRESMSDADPSLLSIRKQELENILSQHYEKEYRWHQSIYRSYQKSFKPPAELHLNWYIRSLYPDWDPTKPIDKKEILKRLIRESTVRGIKGR